MILLEWFGTLLALTGALIMAGGFAPAATAWCLWIVSHILHSVLFYHTDQFGLLALQFIGLLIASMALLNKNSQCLKKALLFLSVMAIISAAVLATKGRLYHEWIGVSLSVGAALLWASTHSLSRFAWILWLASNMLLLALTLQNKQYGLATLQASFALINSYGLFKSLCR